MNFFPFAENEIRQILKPHISSPFVFLETARFSRGNNESFLFNDIYEIIEFRVNSDPALFFEKINGFLARGFWLAGYFAYELGYHLEPSLASLRKETLEPLAWLAVCRKPRVFNHRSPLGLPARHQKIKSYSVRNMTPNIGEKEYRLAIRRIKQYLRQGLTYQVNYTFKINFNFQGSVLDFYVNLRRAQPTSYMALINTGDAHVLSFSPELFFKLNKRTITSCPMKGTAPKGLWPQQDKEKQAQLKLCKKAQAENVMIVDLLRNDIGRISKKVRVRRLYEVESFRTVNQMTSTICARLDDTFSQRDLFEAIFPCGSVTGAPKIKTMQLISGLEKEPR
ncbi:MAG: chorismate-binding protein, partial [Candidatus Omnitrophica bacterium]|nr:chorismate-binding protein [Candidatus Omnitrophota bacterium]